jgi:hypothetical protein
MPHHVVFLGCVNAAADDGTHHLIDVFQVINADSQRDAGVKVIYQTTDGQPVKWISTGVYEIEENRQTLRWVEPTSR